MLEKDSDTNVAYNKLKSEKECNILFLCKRCFSLIFL